MVLKGLFEDLKKYFDNTPQCVIEEDWKEVEHLNEIGPDVIEYALNVNELSGVEIPYSIVDGCQYSFSVNSCDHKDIAADSSYYYAA